ncbi:MAG: efflux RND transporter permease subunit [Rhodospirillaceae bacterium]|nr:efflux RND transporter permease subunit [Rhodospirillaceae bacterium]
MLDSLISLSIKHRLIVVAVIALSFVYGGLAIQSLPIDVLPDLNRPTVTIFTESEGLSPEEVETFVTRPIEAAVYGANGVMRVRSVSSIGLSIVWVEFDWDMDIYVARQIVSEKLSQAREAIYGRVNPVLGPITSIMGNIMAIGVTGGGETDPMTLRTLAEWDIRQRLLAIPGIAQITVVGGALQQFQVLIDPDRLMFHQVPLSAVLEALDETNLNTTGGFLLTDYTEGLIRVLGRAQTVEQIAATIVPLPDQPSRRVTIDQVAEVKLGGPLAPRGDASINTDPGVILSIQKQPDADTVSLVKAIQSELAAIQLTLPDDVALHDDIFSQSTFIETAVSNVEEALRDGAILVAVVLFLFLLNARTTFITLTAIPLSLVLTLIVFQVLGLSINTMTLGGIAIAIGQLVDDAIVGVENVYRRLRQNRRKGEPKLPIDIVRDATREVRDPIIFATFIVILVFLPLFALSGVEGRIFTPLGIAYVTSIAASLIVFLTATPALCAYLLPRMKQMDAEKDGPVVRGIKWGQALILRALFPIRYAVFAVFGLPLGLGVWMTAEFGQAFLPEFNEGALNVSVVMAPGTALAESNRIATTAERLVLELPEVAKVGRRSGRAENDEHAESINVSELEFFLQPSDRPREDVIDDIRDRVEQIPGVLTNIGQPLSHRIDHALSGVRAQIAIKVFGDEMDELRRLARLIEGQIEGVDGVVDLSVEQQVLTGQLHIRVDREQILNRGLTIADVASYTELALNGREIGQIIDGIRTYDLIARFDDDTRATPDSISKLPVEIAGGGYVPLDLLASVEEALGANVINRENGQRRIIVQANVAGRDLVSVVQDIQGRINAEIEMPSGYFVIYGGEYENQSAALNAIVLLAGAAFLGMFLVLYAHLGSVNFTLQVMLSIPLAFVGAVFGVWITGGVLSIATMIGFITLTGIAARNGILMINHYLYLIREEGAAFDKDMITRGTQERIIPVLMTALTAILALIPILLTPDQPGREILHPVAVVIFSGLISSTLLDLTLRPLVFWTFGRSATAAKVAGGLRPQPAE